MEGAAGGAGKRADVRMRLADLAAVERQACVERAEEAFVSADRGNPASMLRPIQLSSQGVGGKELEALVGQWDTLSAAQQQQAFGVLLMVCAEGTWQAQMWRLQLSQLMAVPSQEEFSSTAIYVEGTEQAPADMAAERTVGELALAVLAPAGPPQLTILCHLQRNDKMRLGVACTSLRQASLAWFPEVTVAVQPGKPDMASLAAWLERHQARLRIDLGNATQRKLSEQEWNDSLTALPPLLVISLSTHYPLQDTAPLATLRRLQSLDLSWCSLTAVPTQVSVLTALTCLELANNSLKSGWQHLLPLTQLEALNLSDCGMTNAVPARLSALTALTRLDLSFNLPTSGWQHLLPLTLLQDLSLRCCNLSAVPARLSALTALTHLDLLDNNGLDGGWQHLLPLALLQCLGLDSCDLTAVPEQLSALTALTRLDLSFNLELAGGWQHLLPLTQLQDLNLWGCDLTAVPKQVSVLKALTRLSLSSKGNLVGGRQHLLPLTQLQDLCLAYCGLTAVPQELSKLTALTSLDLGDNPELAGGWQHLQLLIRLRDLHLYDCGLTAVPQQLSALSALTNLNLRHNRLETGWQHLLPLAQLQDLNLQGVPLPGGVAPPELAELRCHVAVDWYHNHDCEDSGASSPASPDGSSASSGDAL